MIMEGGGSGGSAGTGSGCAWVGCRDKRGR